MPIAPGVARERGPRDTRLVTPGRGRTGLLDGSGSRQVAAEAPSPRAHVEAPRVRGSARHGPDRARAAPGLRLPKRPLARPPSSGTRADRRDRSAPRRQHARRFGGGLAVSRLLRHGVDDAAGAFGRARVGRSGNLRTGWMYPCWRRAAGPIDWMDMIRWLVMAALVLAGLSPAWGVVRGLPGAGGGCEGDAACHEVVVQVSCCGERIETAYCRRSDGPCQCAAHPTREPVQPAPAPRPAPERDQFTAVPTQRPAVVRAGEREIAARLVVPNGCSLLERLGHNGVQALWGVWRT